MKHVCKLCIYCIQFMWRCRGREGVNDTIPSGLISFISESAKASYNCNLTLTIEIESDSRMDAILPSVLPLITFNNCASCIANKVMSTPSTWCLSWECKAYL